MRNPPLVVRKENKACEAITRALTTSILVLEVPTPSFVLPSLSVTRSLTAIRAARE